MSCVSKRSGAPQPAQAPPSAARHPAPPSSALNVNVVSALPSASHPSEGPGGASPPAQGDATYPPLRMGAGVWLDCRVSHIDDPENFYVQLINAAGAKDGLPAIMDEVQRHVASTPPGLGQLARRPGLRDAVLACYANASVWYRARVTGEGASAVRHYTG